MLQSFWFLQASYQTFIFLLFNHTYSVEFLTWGPHNRLSINNLTAKVHKITNKYTEV